MIDRDQREIEKRIRLVYPLWIAVSIFSVAYVPSLVYLEGDISTTVRNMFENEELFRWGILGRIVTGVLMIYIANCLYLLFYRIDKKEAMFMLLFAVVCIPFIGVEVYNILALKSENQELIYNYLTISRNTQIVAEVFWGLWLFPLGRLVIASNYLPKFLGFLLYGSCFGYLVGVVIKIVFPEFADLLIFCDVLAFGELIFALWFVFRGIR